MAAMRNRVGTVVLVALAGLAVGLGACSKDGPLVDSDRGHGASVRASDFADGGSTMERRVELRVPGVRIQSSRYQWRRNLTLVGDKENHANR